MEEWIKCVGQAPGVWSPYAHLEELLGRPTDHSEVTERRLQLLHAELESLKPNPGLICLIDELDEAGVPFGIASNSVQSWVADNLTRIGLLDRFKVISTRDRVKHPKPAPDAYLATCSGLRADPVWSVSLEDSASGVGAAVAAGMFSIAVPSEMTRIMDFSGANQMVDSLEELSLAGIRAAIVAARTQAQL
jgi:putative hydrolase of the HAD superfamily